MKTTKILSLIAFLLCFSAIATAVEYSIPNNEIHYTSIDGNIVTPYKTNGFGANIVSNTYENGQGIITFERFVTSIGESAFEGCSSLTSIDIPNSVTTIVGAAFYECSSLASITIPESVTSIGNMAFDGCSSLVSITIPESVTSIGNRAFDGCSSLTDTINIPNGVTTVENGTFFGCSSLTSITIPESVTSIGREAFYGCSSLASITLPNSVTSIGIMAFSGCSSLASITIPESVTSIEYEVFYGCSSLASVTLPNSVTSIGITAFSGCFSLTSITIPESVTNIGSRAFSGCVFVGKDNFINYSSLNAEENNYWGARIADKDIDGLLIKNNTIIACRPYVTSVTIPNSITSIGSAAFEYCSSLTSITIPNSINSIGDGIFSGCYNLSSIVVESGNTTYDSRNNCNAIIHSSTGRLVAGCKNTIIPDNVTTIGSYAFYECSSLASITIPESVTSIGSQAFYGRSSLTSITIPESVTSIGSRAFDGCSSLTSITIPQNITRIADHTFYECSSLTSITIPESVTSIGHSAFSDCSSLTSITIPESVTSIGGWAFSGCSSLTDSINIPNGVTTIEEYTFYGCSSLTSITIPESVTSIGSGAFSYCSSLTDSINIPNGVTTIGEYTFSGCFSLPSITIPNTVTSIGRNAFYDCSSLTTIDIPNSVTTIGDYAFFGCRRLMSSISIPKGITTIGEHTFYNCSSLPSISIPNSVTSIGRKAFEYCSSLTSVSIPDSVTNIGEEAFRVCSSLTSVTIGSRVTNIGDYAFAYCNKLDTIYCNASIPPTLSNQNIFSNYNATLYVPCEALEAYKADAIWGKFSNIQCVEEEHDNKIFYISSDGNIVNIYDEACFGVGIISNTYEDGQGIIILDAPVMSIGKYAFYGCASLISIIIPSSVTNIGYGAFEKCDYLTAFTIPNNVRSIEKRAFAFCSSLTSIIIPNTITSINESTFNYCSSLNSITIPNSVTSIGYSAFSNCESLLSIDFPNSVEEINQSAFWGCQSITSITIPSSVKYIGPAAFSYCNSLSSIVVEDGNNIYDSRDNCNAIIESQTNTLKVGCQNTIIPNSVTDIGMRAFSHCFPLTSIIIPQSVTNIEKEAFMSCISLRSITLPDSVTSIEESAFYNCLSLTSATIGSSVMSIESKAFSECNLLDTIYCYATTPPELLDNEVFSNYDAILYVPCEALEAYKADTIWGMFSNIQCIEEPTPPCENVDTTEYATVCYGETYTWNGQDYATEGAYTMTFSTSNGCDSIATLHLTVLPEAVMIEESVTLNEEQLPYIWRGESCDHAGVYTISEPFANYPYCDSLIYVLNLIVDAPNKCGDHLYWHYSNNTMTITGYGAMYDDPDLLSYRTQDWYPARVNNIVLPEAITHIGNVAFADCANITSIVIPSSVTSIGDGAFSWTGLQVITIPASVTDLGEQVFEACNGLHTVLYESEPRSISNQTIHPLIGCVRLDTIIAPAALWHCTTADPALEARYGVPHKARYIEVTDGELTNQAIKYIANNSGAMEILDLTNATNTTLPYGAWSNSYQLSTLYLPQQIEVIPESMVEGARNLSEIAIPATVMEIGNYAFAGCVNVWHMTVEAVIPPKVYENTFDGISRSISVQVPAGSEDLYREAAYWREFFIEHTNTPSSISNCQKLLREDQILILRNGKVYTAMGQLVNTEE